MPNSLVRDVRSGVRDERNRCDRQEVWEGAIRFFGSHAPHDAPLHWSRPVGAHWLFFKRTWYLSRRGASGARQSPEGWTIQYVEVLSETLRRGAAAAFGKLPLTAAEFDRIAANVAP